MKGSKYIEIESTILLSEDELMIVTPTNVYRIPTNTGVVFTVPSRSKTRILQPKINRSGGHILYPKNQ